MWKKMLRFMYKLCKNDFVFNSYSCITFSDKIVQETLKKNNFNLTGF